MTAVPSSLANGSTEVPTTVLTTVPVTGGAGSVVGHQDPLGYGDADRGATVGRPAAVRDHGVEVRNAPAGGRRRAAGCTSAALGRPPGARPARTRGVRRGPSGRRTRGGVGCHRW